MIDIMLDASTEISISYTTLNFGKLVISIPNQNAMGIIEAILTEVGITPFIKCFNVEDLEVIEEYIKESK